MWGTCLGFELLPVLASGLKTEELLVSCDAENYSVPLEFAGGKTLTNNDYSNNNNDFSIINEPGQPCATQINNC